MSRVFNPHAQFPIAEATRRRVERAASELGYSPNRLARALITGSTNLIILRIPQMNPYYALIAREMQQLMVNSGHEMMISIHLLNAAEERNAYRPFPCDGLIVADLADNVRTGKRSDAPGGTPMVCIGSHGAAGADFVAVDLQSGAHEAVRHLIEAGARRIAFITPEGTCREGEARYDGYAAAIREAGLEPLSYPLSWGVNQLFSARSEQSRLEIAAHLDREIPDAVFCWNDDCALAILAELQSRGLRVPQDVLLCGCDGLPDLVNLVTPITTLVQPIDKMCGLAWEMLAQRIQDLESPLRQIWMQPSLVIRASTQRL